MYRRSSSFTSPGFPFWPLGPLLISMAPCCDFDVPYFPQNSTRCAQEVCSTHPHPTLIPTLNPHFSNESQFFLSVSRLYFLSKQFPRCNSCPEVKMTRAVTRSGRWVFSFLQDHTMQKTGSSGANCKITLPSESKH